ncbi:MAG: RICIN domain-containing protein, partial [Muribaculaceae bacterium]|nr:RICIN domain-containing protein [Muribaculaceae bacterium]
TDHPYRWRLAVDGRYLESVFGALVFSEKSESTTQLWRLELQEDGCYRLQSVADGKMLSVSGAAQLAGTPVFMSAPNEDGSQSFGLYFDAREHDYE